MLTLRWVHAYQTMEAQKRKKTKSASRKRLSMLGSAIIAASRMDRKNAVMKRVAFKRVLKTSRV